VSEYNFPHLPVATSLGEVADYADAVHASEYPAFQVDAESIGDRRGSFLLAELAVLAALEDANYRNNGTPIPFTVSAAWPNTSMNGKLETFAPHTDGIDLFRALAFHRELFGSTTALFGHMIDPSDIDFFASDARGRTESFMDVADRLQHTYQAQIRPDRFTVFSEGNLGNLQPAVHYFERPAGQPAIYSRITSSVKDADLKERNLEDAAAQCRLRVLRDRYLWQITSHLFPFSYPNKDATVSTNLSTAQDAEAQNPNLTHPGRYLQYVGEEDLLIADGDRVVLQ